MEELITLNPGVQWHYGAVNSFDACDGTGYCITAELRLATVPLSINQGIMVGKFSTGE
jgi:hypothetical protein